jgi:putative flippase GtrA
MAPRDVDNVETAQPSVVPGPTIPVQATGGRDVPVRAAAAHPVVTVFRHSAVRYVMVGGFSFVVDAGALFVLHGVLGMWLPVATALAFTAAFFVNFGLNHTWAFTRASAVVGRRFTRYIALVVANLGVTVLLMQALTWLGLHYLPAKAACTGLLFVTNYVVSKKWIYTEG